MNKIEQQFFEAVKEDNLEIVKELVKSKKINVNIKDADNITPLHYAVANWYLEIVKELVKKDAYLDIQDNNGWTPLEVAEELWNENIIEYFKKK